tara:strand:+ start:2127 stop:2768 length:642 start_codon:yes stop_codon:yes gene_type:complete
MKFSQIKNILLIALIGFVIFTQFFSSSDPVIPKPVEVVIPEIVGKVEDKINDVEETVVSIPDPITPEIITKIVVDKEYKEKYEKAIKENDSIKAMNLFLKSIEINEYNKVLIDNDTIKIVAYAKTRGILLKYKIDYTIKEKTITYIPEVITERPKFTLLTGVALIVPTTTINQTMVVKLDFGFQNKKGNIIEIGYDTQKNIYLGYKQSIRFRK